MMREDSIESCCSPSLCSCNTARAGHSGRHVLGERDQGCARLGRRRRRLPRGRLQPARRGVRQHPAARVPDVVRRRARRRHGAQLDRRLRRRVVRGAKSAREGGRVGSCYYGDGEVRVGTPSPPLRRRETREGAPNCRTTTPTNNAATCAARPRAAAPRYEDRRLVRVYQGVLGAGTVAWLAVCGALMALELATTREYSSVEPTPAGSPATTTKTADGALGGVLRRRKEPAVGAVTGLRKENLWCRQRQAGGFFFVFCAAGIPAHCLDGKTSMERPRRQGLDGKASTARPRLLRLPL